MLSSILLFFRRHGLVIVFALLVGTLSVGQQVFSILDLRGGYQGIQFLFFDDEDNYMAIVREVIDGHWLAAAPEFLEYKDDLPFMLPFGAYLYAVPTIISGLDLSTIFILSKFIFPALLFLLIYQFIFLLGSTESTIRERRVNAIAGGLFVTIGQILLTPALLYGLFGGASVTEFFLWTRPINPITGALSLFGFFLLLWRIIHRTYKWDWVFAGILLSVMISYYFSWGVGISVGLFLFIFMVVVKRYDVARDIGLALGSSMVLLVPYWLVVFIGGDSSSGGIEALRRYGVSLTHKPVFNKQVIAGILVFVPFLWIELRRLGGRWRELGDWWIMCTAMLAGSLWVYNQQLITGLNLWHHHFVQYTTPVVISVTILLLFNVVRKKVYLLWYIVIVGIIFSSVVAGAATMYSYRHKMIEFRDLQGYAPVLRWLESESSDECVVLSTYSVEGINTLIPAFTHCETYISGQVFTGAVPWERIYHNFFISLRMRGIDGESVSDYLYSNPGELRAYFFEDWNQLFSLSNEGEWFESVVVDLTTKYRYFLEGDFSQQLRKYQLDYMVSGVELTDMEINFFGGLRLVGRFDKIYLYELID